MTGLQVGRIIAIRFERRAGRGATRFQHAGRQPDMAITDAVAAEFHLEAQVRPLGGVGGRDVDVQHDVDGVYSVAAAGVDGVDLDDRSRNFGAREGLCVFVEVAVGADGTDGLLDIRLVDGRDLEAPDDGDNLGKRERVGLSCRGGVFVHVGSLEE